MRVGVQVPIVTTNEGKEDVKYRDVGTNIDCTASTAGDGRFVLDMKLERSTVRLPSETVRGATTPAPPAQHSAPSFMGYGRLNTRLLLRDGQAVEAIMSTDPVSGRVLKVEVTLHVLK